MRQSDWPGQFQAGDGRNHHAAIIPGRIRAAHYLLLLALIGMLHFINNLGEPTLWDLDEGRNAVCALEMKASGNYIVPTFNSQLRVDKPALMYWPADCLLSRYSASMRFAVRFPSALAALGTLLLLLRTGPSHCFDRLPALLGGTAVMQHGHDDGGRPFRQSRCPLELLHRRHVDSFGMATWFVANPLRVPSARILYGSSAWASCSAWAPWRKGRGSGVAAATLVVLVFLGLGKTARVGVATRRLVWGPGHGTGGPALVYLGVDPDPRFLCVGLSLDPQFQPLPFRHGYPQRFSLLLCCRYFYWHGSLVHRHDGRPLVRRLVDGARSPSKPCENVAIGREFAANGLESRPERVSFSRCSGWGAI